MKKQSSVSSGSSQNCDTGTSPADSSFSIQPSSFFNAALLRRFEYLLLLAATAAAVLIYPLRLQDNWYLALDQIADGKSVFADLMRDQIEPFLVFHFSPLIIKGVLALVPLLGFVAVCGIRWLLFPDEGQRTKDKGQIWKWISIPGFFLWVAVSAAWSPTPSIAWQAALWAVVFGLFMFALLRRGLSPSEARGFGLFLVALGCVTMSIAILEAVPWTSKFAFMFMYRFEDIRNQFGSLLGHNTAAASFLMLTAFPAFSFLMTSRTTGRRVFFGAYLAVLLFAVIVVQSRAIWVLLPLLGLLAIRSALRAVHAGSRLRWIPAGVLAVLALVLVTQMVDKPWNPLYMKESPLSQRLKAISPQGLKEESRLRLNIISATLVPDHPVIGYGLYAYQYVYPRRQAEFFAAHPETKLNATRMRSDRAHDEYMQVLVDHGVIGLGLMAWMLWQIAASGWRRRRELEGPARLIHEGLGWSALGFGLHALVDFPYHLPQIAIPGVLCMAAWATFRNAEPGNAECGMRNAEMETATAGTFRPAVFLRLLGAFMLVFFAALLSFPLIRCLQGDLYYNRGESDLTTYRFTMGPALKARDELIGQNAALVAAIRNDARLAQPDRDSLSKQTSQTLAALTRLRDYEVTPDIKTTVMRQILDATDGLARAHASPEIVAQGETLIKNLEDFTDYPFARGVDTLNNALLNLRRSLEISPYNELIRLELSGVYLYLGSGFYGASKAAAGDAKLAEKAVASARDFLNRGLDVLKVAGKGIDFDKVYWLRAQFYQKLGAMDPSSRNAAEYRRNVRLAMFYCPSEPSYMKEVLRLLEHDPRPDATQIMAVRRQLWKYDPTNFEHTYIYPASQAIKTKRYPLAVSLWEDLIKVDPNKLEWVADAAVANMMAGNRPRALELIRIVRRENAAVLLNGTVLFEKALEKDYKEMLHWFDFVPVPEPVARAQYRALELEGQRRLGRTSDRMHFGCPPGVSEERWKVMVAEAMPEALLHYFDDPQRARQAFDERLQMAGPPPGPGFWVDGFMVGESVKDHQMMLRCLDEVRRADPNNPALPDLVARAGR